MISLRDINEVRGIQSNLRSTFESPQGKEAMRIIEQIGSWTPSVFDSIETNEVIARDANRRLIGTIKTLLELSPEQIVAMANQEE
jgi:hypothetical protein